MVGLGPLSPVTHRGTQGWSLPSHAGSIIVAKPSVSFSMADGFAVCALPTSGIGAAPAEAALSAFLDVAVRLCNP